MDSKTFLLPGERAVEVGGKVRVIDNGRGLCWGTDAYLLAAFIRRRRRAQDVGTDIAGQVHTPRILRACELGSGCGVVSFLVAAHGKADTVTALEINGDACDRTRRGIPLNGLDGRVQVFRKDIREAKPEDAACGGRFDFVFANPPYIAHPGLSGTDAVAEDARHENHGGIDDFCAAAARLLRSRGSFYVVFRPERVTDLLCALRAHRLEPKRMTFVYPDTASKPSLCLCEAALGAAAGLQMSPPAVFYADTQKTSPRTVTDTMAQIYETCSFDCLFAQNKKAGAHKGHE